MNPGALIPWAQKGLIFFIIILFGLAIYTKYLLINLNNKPEKLSGNQLLKLPRFALKKLFSFFIANGIIGLTLLFFTYERITLFSSRFWFIAWGAFIALYLYNLDRQIKLNKKRKEQYKKEKSKKKYMP